MSEQSKAWSAERRRAQIFNRGKEPGGSQEQGEVSKDQARVPLHGVPLTGPPLQCHHPACGIKRALDWDGLVETVFADEVKHILVHDKCIGLKSRKTKDATKNKWLTI